VTASNRAAIGQSIYPTHYTK